jgi:hypothetical protein
MIVMIEAKEIQVMQERISISLEPENVRMPKCRTKAACEIVNQVVCLQSVDEVYLLGVKMQDYLGAAYNELAVLSAGPKKKIYSYLAKKQLGAKKEIETLANNNLNKLLQYFYENGGPIIEPPVSEELAREIKPFFKKIMESFLNQVDSLINKAARDEISSSDLEIEVNYQFINMYTAISRLYQAEEIQNTFNELISIKKD